MCLYTFSDIQLGSLKSSIICYDGCEIMKLGNTFVRIGSPKFLLTFFRPN
jgi:hypothetical protein